MENTILADPFGSFYFALEIDNTEVGHFLECSGLKSSTTVFEIEEGGLNGFTHKRPSGSKWENIVLKYATSYSTYLLEWRDAFIQNPMAGRRSGSIRIMNNDGKVVRRFSFKNAWPVGWEGPSLTSDSSGLAIETVEIAHEGLEISGEESSDSGSTGSSPSSPSSGSSTTPSSGSSAPNSTPNTSSGTARA